jgi:hypothetical protein
VRLFLVAALVWLLAGCSAHTGECGGHYTVEPSFYLRHQPQLVRVEARWDAFASRPVDLEPGYGARCHILSGKPGPQYAGLYDSDTGNIIIDEDSQNARFNFEGLLLHEIGHSFGMDHVKDPKAIMVDTAGPDFTDADLQECQRVNACL